MVTITKSNYDREALGATLERIMREIGRRTRVVGVFPAGNSALLLVSARLRHIAGKTWGTKRYMDMSRLREAAAPSSTPDAASA